MLKGATLFLADLARCIDRDVEIDFVAVSSYGAATQSTGEVRVLKDLDTSVTDKHVIIVEDILDTGLTLRFSYLIETLRARHARSVKVCVLLDKPARRRVQVDVDYRGFEIEDKFVVGYGMDYAERYRNLRYIGVVTFEATGDGRLSAASVMTTAISPRWISYYSIHLLIHPVHVRCSYSLLMTVRFVLT